MFTENHSENENKCLIRQEIIKELKLIKNKHGRILTLPHLNFDVELEAIKIGYSVNTVEKEKDIFNKQKINFGGLPRQYLEFNNSTVYEFLLKHSHRKYDLAYLDYCGSVSKELLKTLAELMDRCPLIYITVYLAREHLNFEHFFISENKTDDYENIFNFFGFKVVNKFIYQNGIAPMVTFKIVRNFSLKRKTYTITEDNNMIKGFTLVEKKTTENNLVIGTFNGNSASQKIRINPNTFKLMGLSTDRKYEIYFNGITKQIALVESESNNAYKVTRNPNNYSIEGTSLCKKFGIKTNFNIVSYKKNDDINGVILQLKVNNNKIRGGIKTIY